jgi:hypothetical protein
MWCKEIKNCLTAEFYQSPVKDLFLLHEKFPVLLLETIWELHRLLRMRICLSVMLLWMPFSEISPLPLTSLGRGHCRRSSGWHGALSVPCYLPIVQTAELKQWTTLLRDKRKRSIGWAADFGRWFSVAQWTDGSRRACAVTLFCLSNNSDVEVTGSLLLLHCMLLSRAIRLILSADEISSWHRLTLMRWQWRTPAENYPRPYTNIFHQRNSQSRPILFHHWLYTSLWHKAHQLGACGNSVAASVRISCWSCIVESVKLTAYTNIC